MDNKFISFLCASLLLLPGSAAHAQKESMEETVLWGNVIYSEYDYEAYKPKYSQAIYAFKPEANITLTQRFRQSPRETINANGGGAYYDSLFHFVLLAENEATHSYDVYSREYSYANDTLRFNRKGIKLNDFSLYAKAGVAVDPTTGFVYGIFSSQNNLTRQLGIIDYDNLSRTTIAVLKNSYYAFAVNSKGEAFGITDEGDLMRIDKRTGEETVVGFTGVTPRDMTQSATFDLKTDRLYWAAEVYQEDGSVLYEVNTATGKATKIDMFPGRAQMAALYCPNSAYSDKAPAKPTDVKATFEGGSLEGKVEFCLPTTDIAGRAISGEMSYTVFANGEQVATGSGSPGAREVVSYTAATDGEDYIFSVMPANDNGNGQPALASSWVGHDIPDAPADVKLAISASGEATLTWTAPTKGQHGGYLETPLRYIITRVPGDILTFTHEGTTFTEQLPAGDLTTYYYTVRSLNGELYSEPVASNEVAYGSALSVPYYEDFSQESAFNTFTIVDANNDGTTWNYNSYDHAAAIDNSLKGIGDDWLITPPIRMEQGHTYKLAFTVIAKASSSPGVIAAAVGGSYAPEDFKVVVPATKVSTTSKALTLEGTYTVPADGEYHLGFHATSPVGFSSVDLDNISIIDDTAAGITGIADDTLRGGEVYTIQGRKAGTNHRGLVIVRDNDGNCRKAVASGR